MVPKIATILIIEKRQKSLEIIKKGLGKNGITVLTANNFRDGRDLFIRKPVDLVFASTEIGQNTDDYLAFFIKERAPDVPFIIITEPDERLSDDNFEEGFVDSQISKPLNLDAINRIIFSYIH